MERSRQPFIAFAGGIYSGRGFAGGGLADVVRLVGTRARSAEGDDGLTGRTCFARRARHRRDLFSELGVLLVQWSSLRLLGSWQIPLRVAAHDAARQGR